MPGRQASAVKVPLSSSVAVKDHMATWSSPAE